ncbi:MAG: FRG domain-containing protein [Paludibacteraceae bacterium]
MQETITSIEQLQTLIANLPTVKEGYVRVFRGQTGRFPSINATLHRKQMIEGRNLWDSYCFILAKYLEGLENIRYNRKNQETDDLSTYFFWVKALSQHYGPGTEFLDVTHSLNVALWFAFNEIEKKSVHLYTGKLNEKVSKEDVINIIDTNCYKKTNRNGWLYIFDAKISDSLFPDNHGDLVDVIANAPTVFRKSARLHAQRACLMKCDKDIDSGDCSKFLVCEPIEIKANVVDFLIQDTDITKLFPSPDYDEWYKRFLQVPYTYYGYSEDGNMASCKSIPLDIYFDDYKETLYVKSITSKILTINPLSMYLFCLKQEDSYLDVLKETTPIIIVAPLLTTSNKIAKGEWHEELLWSNAGLKKVKRPPQKMTNIIFNLFFEFSPLEIPYWESIDTGGEGEWIRSIWIINFNKEELYVKINVQSFPGESENISYYEFLVIYDSQLKSLMYSTKNGEVGVLSNLEYYAKPLYVALSIIGDCKDGIKYKPFTSLKWENQGVVKASDKSAIILPGSDILGLNKRYYGVYNIETDEPYIDTGQYLTKNNYEDIFNPIDDFFNASKVELDKRLDNLIDE